MAKNSLTVGFLGGSLTAGAGASDPERTSWRGKICTWMQKSLGDSMTVKPINAAIGGTGSEFAAYRLKFHLLEKGVPDLCFIEFAVNDDGFAEEAVLRSMDGIMQQLLRANPEMRIYFVYTIKESYEPYLDARELSPPAAWHHEIAQHYGVDEIRLGQPLYRALKERGGGWKSLLPDGVHPNDEGYQVYFETIRDFLANENRQWAEPSKAREVKPYTERPNIHGNLLDAAGQGRSKGWAVVDKPLPGKLYPRYLEAHRGASAFSFTISGTAFGIFWVVARDGGSLEVTIDGKRRETLHAWDPHALRVDRPGYRLVADDLAAGRHEVSLKVRADAPGQSEGTFVRIAAFLVETN